MKNLGKRTRDVLIGTTSLGIGASVMSGIGGDVGAAGASTMGNMAKGLPAVGSIMGAGMVIDSLSLLSPKKGKK